MKRIIRLHKADWKNNKVIGFSPILINPLEIITIKDYMFDDGTIGSDITYKKAMVDGFKCKETMDEIYNLINEK